MGMGHPATRFIFDIMNYQNVIMLIVLFLNLGFQAKSRKQAVQSDGLSNFILILALCEAMNFMGNAIMRDLFFKDREISLYIGFAVIVLSWIIAVGFTVWNYFYLKRLEHQQKQ